MIKNMILPLVILVSTATSAFATTPAGSWTLEKDSPDVKDYFFRIDVDPGEDYSNPGYAPSSVYFSQYVSFNNASGGYLGIQRTGGVKNVLVSIWDGLSAKGGVLSTVDCYEFGECSSISGYYDWKVGHKYRFRVEKSPRTASDNIGDWWQITLADLTLGTINILGEIKTPKWGGLGSSNGTFLEYFWGPDECTTLRHSKVTEAQIKGDYGQSTKLSSSSGTPYGDPHICDKKYILPGMTEESYGSTSWDDNGTLTLLGNNYRGIHNWGDYQQEANKGMMFVSNTTDNEPYIYKAVHDGKYGYFPAEGSNNNDWESVGRGYPIINDLYFRNQKLYTWEERNDQNVKIGDYFVIDNTSNQDTEFFKKLKSTPGYFPIDKSSNDDWEYIGRYPKEGELLSPDLPIHNWGDLNRIGKKGWLYYNESSKSYYILKADGQYFYLPKTSEDNQWWQFVGYHP